MVTFGIFAVAASVYYLSPVSYAQSGLSTDIGNNTLYNFDRPSATRQSVANTDFYNFSDGSSSTRNSIGNIDIGSSL